VRYHVRFLAAVCFFLLYSFARAQIAINPVPVAGSNRITVTTGDAPAGSTIAIFKTAVQGKCGAAATAVPLIAGLANTIEPTGTTLLQVGETFTANEILCALVTRSDNQQINSPTEVTVAPTAASISPVPGAGQNTLTLNRGPVANGSTFAIFSLPTGAQCAATATGATTLLAPSAPVIVRADQTIALLKDKLTAGELVCAIFTTTGGTIAAPTTTTTATDIVTAGPAVTVAVPSTYGFSLSEGSQASVGAQINLVITATDSNGKTLDDFNGDVLVQTSDSAATLKTDKVTLAQGTGVAVITFITPGKQTVIVSGNGAKGTLDLAVDTSVAGCSSCYASIGAGAALYNHDLADYEEVQNVLQKTHLGNSTPQYLVGLAYKLPWHTLWGIKFGKGGSLYTRMNCTVNDFAAGDSDSHAAYCYPFKAFISLKFSPDASQTFSGFTYGISHAVHKKLDILLGLSYTPYSEPSEGFQAAAINTLKTQSANPCYAQFSVAQLTATNGRNNYDGFPTQLLTNTAAAGAPPVCTAGAQIYAGSALVTEHHSGFFVGISVPIGFKTFFGGK